jgi:hypothetical protein
MASQRRHPAHSPSSQLQIAQRQYVEDGGARQQRASYEVREWLGSSETVRSLPASEQRSDQRDMTGKAYPGDKKRRHPGKRQIFDRRVEKREQHIGRGHINNGRSWSCAVF